MPSSKTFSESSSDSVPASSWPTICSSRVRQSSNLRSVIALLRPLDATVEASPAEQHFDGVAGRDVRGVSYHVTGGGAREAVAAAEHGQRRQRIQPADQRPQSVLRVYERPRRAAVQS